MKKLLSMCLLTGLLLAAGMVYGGEKAPSELVEYVNSTLTKLGVEDVIVRAVKAENAKGKTLSQIQARDEEWKATPGVADYMKTMMGTDCSRFLKSYQNKYTFIAEVFVMDNLGANVAMTDKTSDYWQGDESKFKKSYDGGKGAVFVDEVEFDESSQSYCVQVSFPVKDGGKVIGAVTVGIDIDMFEENI